MAKKIVLVDVFYLHVAKTGIRTYIRTFCEQAEAVHSEAISYVITPDWRSADQSVFFKGKASKTKNWLFQCMYFLRKLVVLPLMSYWYRADIVFSPDILSPIWSRGKKVSVIHDAFFWENPSHYNALWLKVFKGFLYQSLRRNGVVVTISHYSKGQLQKYLPFPQLPIMVVHPASHVKSSEKPNSSTNLISSRYFLHVGVTEKRKNLPVLVEAMALLTQNPSFCDCKLVLLGQRGPREALDDYQRITDLIDQLGLGEIVLLPGYVDDATVEAYYRHAVGYVFPSLSEGFGMPLLEAFFYKLPVIISNQGALREIGDDAVLVVGQATPEGFAKAMETLLIEKEYRELLVKRGLIRLESFSPASFFSNLDAFFVQLLEPQAQHRQPMDF
nr:glycosyltransferase [Cytophagales bacterium]